MAGVNTLVEQYQKVDRCKTSEGDAMVSYRKYQKIASKIKNMKKFGQKIDNNVQVSAYRRKIHVEDESDWIDAM